MAKFIIAGKLWESRSQGLSVAVVRPGVLTTTSNGGASGFGEPRPAVTAWQPEQFAFANARPRVDGPNSAASAFILSVEGLAATSRDIRPGLQALSVSTTRERTGNLRIVDAYRAGAGARQYWRSGSAAASIANIENNSGKAQELILAVKNRKG
jgi:hypothetical protein